MLRKIVKEWNLSFSGVVGTKKQISTGTKLESYKEGVFFWCCADDTISGGGFHSRKY